MQKKLLGLSLLILFGNVQAHHSNAPHFDTDIEISKTGTVTEWRFVNPHAFLYFDVVNEDGSVSQWRCETDAASGLKQRSYTATTFIIGEEVRVIGNPARREENHCFFRDFIFSDGTVVDRNTDMASVNRGVSLDTSGQEIEDIPAILFGDEPNISGYWWDGEPAADIPPLMTSLVLPAGMTGMGIGPEGALPPRLERIASIGLTPAGQSVMHQYERIYDDPALHCKISNIIDALGRDETVNEIRQHGDTITMLYGYMDYERTIYLDIDSHPNQIEPTPGGHSIGRWEANTLIVDSVGFTPSVFNAQIGIPTSEAFHVVERITFDENTDTLRREYTANDPAYWDGEFSGNDSYGRSPTAYSPYNCETLSGLNNLRPGTPEYEAESARIEATAAQAGAQVPVTVQSSARPSVTIILTSIAAVLLAALALVAIRKRRS